MGDYVPAVLDFLDGELCLGMIATQDFKGEGVFFYDNGKCSRVPLDAYQTLSNRKKLTNAVSPKGELVWCVGINEHKEFSLFSTNGRMLIIDSNLIPVKTTKSTQGVTVMSLRKGQTLKEVRYPEGVVKNESKYRYRSRKIPATGAIFKDSDAIDGISRE